MNMMLKVKLIVQLHNETGPVIDGVLSVIYPSLVLGNLLVRYDKSLQMFSNSFHHVAKTIVVRTQT